MMHIGRPVAGEPHPYTLQNHENATPSADWSDHHSTDDAADASTVTRQCCMPDVVGSRGRVMLHLVWVPLACRPPPCLGPVGVSSSTLSGSRCCVILSLNWVTSIVSCSTLPPACVLLLHHLPPWRRLSRHPSYCHGVCPVYFSRWPIVVDFAPFPLLIHTIASPHLCFTHPTVSSTVLHPPHCHIHIRLQHQRSGTLPPDLVVRQCLSGL